MTNQRYPYGCECDTYPPEAGMIPEVKPEPATQIQHAENCRVYRMDGNCTCGAEADRARDEAAERDGYWSGRSWRATKEDFDTGWDACLEWVRKGGR